MTNASNSTTKPFLDDDLEDSIDMQMVIMEQTNPGLARIADAHAEYTRLHILCHVKGVTQGSAHRMALRGVEATEAMLRRGLDAMWN